MFNAFKLLYAMYFIGSKKSYRFEYLMLQILKFQNGGCCLKQFKAEDLESF